MRVDTCSWIAHNCRAPVRYSWDHYQISSSFCVMLQLLDSAEWIWKFSSLGLQNCKCGCSRPTGRLFFFFHPSWRGMRNWTKVKRKQNMKLQTRNCQLMSVELEDTQAGIQWQKHSEYKVNKISFFQYIDWRQNRSWIKNQSGCLPWRSKLREDGIFLTVIPFYALSLHTRELKFLRALELHHKNPLKVSHTCIHFTEDSCHYVGRF